MHTNYHHIFHPSGRSTPPFPPTVRGLRIVWDLFVYLLAFGCIHSYALNRFATTDDQSFYFAQAVRDMLVEVSPPQMVPLLP